MIRLYKKEDYPIIQKWWIFADEQPPSEESLPKDSTFVLLKDNKIIASVCAYLTNSKEISFIENLVKNPDANVTKEDINQLMNHIFNYVKEQGYARTICLAYKEPLKKRYLDFGFKKTLDNLSSFVKEL